MKIIPRPRRWFYKPNAKTPKVKNPAIKPGLIITGLLVSLNATTGNCRLYNVTGKGHFKGNRDKEKAPTGAGRGGKHCGKVSAMGRMAESIPAVKRAKKEHIPYKPMAHLHTLYGLTDIGRGKAIF